ncbi:ISAs1 family transposase [Ramlibacter sp.]|jgi:predicted transposase YbfD/YdcC|uniref:ISAs1 family transposase n=1 Tax=Ramlibacter sp. TaxID=1917967 RepID=UPI0035B0333D
METEDRLRLAEVFVSITDPRQPGKVEHDLVELLVVAVSAVLVGADTFVEIELWAKEKLDWLQGYLKLEHGIPSHDTFGRLFGLIDPGEFEAAFRRWVSSVVPALGAEIVAIDGKTSRRSGKVDATPLHLVSAFAAGAGLVLGQRATAEKSNEKTAIPQLLSVLALEGCIVTIDAMGTQANIAQAIRERGADYVLAVKDNQPILADSVRDFFALFKAAPEKTPHTVAETVEKDHGRLETRRCYAFDQLACLHRAEQWPGLKSFAVIESERLANGKLSTERRFYISSLPAEAARLAYAARQHWKVENCLHWCMDVAFADDQMRARTGHAAHNLSVLKQLTLNLIRLDPTQRKGGIKARRLIAATSDSYRAQLLRML